MKAFFEEEVSMEWAHFEGDRWSSKPARELASIRMTPFRFIVWTEIKRLCMDRIVATMQEDAFKTAVHQNFYYGGDGATQYTPEVVIGQFLEKKLEELAPKMAQAFFLQSFANLAEGLKANIMDTVRSEVTNGNGPTY